MIPIFDGHNDVLLRLWMKKSSAAVSDFIIGDGKGHIDLPRLKAGGFAGGFFAIFVPPEVDNHDDNDEDLNPPYAGAVGQSHAVKATFEMADLLFRMERDSGGGFKICRTVADIRQCMKSGIVAAIFHIEGAEVIGADLTGLEFLYKAGLRSIGPVWSRPNQFGEGVPFRFPSSPDTGSGLTDAGKELVQACNKLRILIDLSHLTEKGFWDVAKLSDAPLVATHSNAHALCASSRNLTDDQLRAIGKSGGMVGLNYATGFLRDDGRWSTQTDATVMITHLEHMIKIAGEDSVALGSDFDGARIPAFIGDVSGQQNLVTAMRDAGFGDTLIAKITSENWLRVLERTWG